MPRLGEKIGDGGEGREKVRRVTGAERGKSVVERAFTLIELLIVVAIIAVLAAIAVPNFLDAATRAKAARVNSDQRTIAVALEAHFADNDYYPLRNSKLAPPKSWQRQLTSPLSYLSGVFVDPFCTDNTPANKYYQYAHCEAMRSWILVSVGPDGMDDFDDAAWKCPLASLYPPTYDPTNGAASRGDIWRVSKQGGPIPMGCCQ